ncbi:MAG: OmpH family outer membrane protein [Acidobacteria bacterium]|nr:OmpH family outer membrane protein [Acidobacteriota bacterium]
MNRTLVFATALAAGLAASSVLAQAPASASAKAAPAAPTAVAPEAIPAKVAVIAFEQGVVATNEGQQAVAAVQKKYEPKKATIDSESAEVDSLKKQYQALPATLSDEERASRLKAIDTKQKELQRDVEDAQNAYNTDVQEAYGKVAQKFGGTAVKYAQDHGFTLLLNIGGQQQLPTVLWWQQSTDITQAVINAYNVASGVAAPTPSAPTPHRAPAAAPHK